MKGDTGHMHDIDPQATWFQATRALQTRIERSDLDGPKQLEAIEQAAQLTHDGAKKCYAPIG
jgi:hypothetical protein